MNKERIKYWLPILSKFVSVQLFVQIVGFASGILLVRTLSKQEYAFFTLANSMQATMSVLADSGISSAMVSIGGKFWQNSYRFGQLVNTAIKLRRYLATIVSLICTPILFWLMIKNGSSISYTIFLSVGILIGLNFHLTYMVMGIVPRLHSQINRIQQLDMLFAISRLVLLIGAYFTFLNALVAVFASTIAAGLQNLKIRHFLKDTIDINAPVNKKDQTDILKFVKAESAYTMFCCIQGQLVIWLISIFGTTRLVAEVGALTRLGVIFTLIGSVMGSIVLPSYARCQSSGLLVHRYRQILGTYSCFAIAILGIAALFPGELLWVLGKQYANLQAELFWMVASLALQSISGAVIWLNRVRGWVGGMWLIVPSTIMVQIFLLSMLDVSTIKGVLFFGIFSTLPTLIIGMVISYNGFHSGAVN